MDEDITTVIITTSRYEDCLHDLCNAITSNEVRFDHDDLFVYVGHTSQLKMVENKWSALSDEDRKRIKSYAGGFVDGWEWLQEKGRNDNVY